MKKFTALALGTTMVLGGMCADSAFAADVIVPNGDQITLQNSTADAIIDNGSSHIRFRDASGVRMAIRGNGRVGIGVASPADQLHVAAGIRSSSYTLDTGLSAGGILQLNSSGNSSQVIRNVDGELTVRSGGTLALSVNGAGDTVTVGGTTSTAVLEIRGSGNDVAEGFVIHTPGPEVKPGMVVAISAENPGEMELSSKPYQRTVAGVISGAGDKRVGIQLGNAEEVARGELTPVALTGQVWCYMDTSKDGIAPGDMLTTSSIPGYAMKATDHVLAQGAIIGKAMTPLAQGEAGMVLVLVSLQ